jgi:VWFA-related protein
MQSLRLTNMVPQIGIALAGRQPDCDFPRVAQPDDQKSRDCGDQHPRDEKKRSSQDTPSAKPISSFIASNSHCRQGHNFSHKKTILVAFPDVLKFLAKANLCLAILLAVGNAFAQESPTGQQPSFRTQSNLVLTPALVKDKHGAIVYGLEAGDFIIEDDGVEQAVRLDDAPESAPVSLVVAIQLGRSAAEEMQRIRTLGTMLDPILSEGRNRAAIVTFDGEVELTRGFTTNGALIAADLNRLRPGGDQAAILDAVGYSVALLKQEPPERRRVLLLVSETRDHGSHVVSYEDTVRAIADSNTLVYTLAFSPAASQVLDNLRGRHPQDERTDPRPTDPTQEEILRGDTMPDGSPRGGLQWMPLLIMAAQAMRKNAPKTIAEVTGGEYELFTSHKAFEARMVDFTNHLHNRYLLSFEPKDPHPGLHKIRVTLRRARDVNILARERYWVGSPPK